MGASDAGNRPGVISIVVTTSPVPGEMERFLAAVGAAGCIDGCEVELVVVDDLGLWQGQVPAPAVACGVAIRLVSPATPDHIRSVISGFAAASGEIVVALDPDMYRNLADVPRFLAEYRAGRLLVYGRRVARSDVSALRFRLSRFYNRALAWALELPVHDINTPMLLVARPLVPDILAHDPGKGHVKLYFPMVLGARFSEISIVVEGEPKRSAYSALALLRFMWRQLREINRLRGIARGQGNGG